MNIGGWGPSEERRAAIANVQSEIQNRFGIRRFKLRMIPKRDRQNRLGPQSQVIDRRSRMETEIVDSDADDQHYEEWKQHG